MSPKNKPLSMGVGIYDIKRWRPHSIVTRADLVRWPQGCLETEQSSSDNFGCKSRKPDSDLATEVRIISYNFKPWPRGWVDSVDHKWHEWSSFYQCLYSAIHSVKLVVRWFPQVHDLAAAIGLLSTLCLHLVGVRKNTLFLLFSFTSKGKYWNL